MQRRGEHRPRFLAERLRGQRRGGRRIERLDDELVQPSRAAEIGAEPAQRVAARDLLVAIRAEDEQRPFLGGGRERREQLEGRRIRPLQVVEEGDRRRVPAHGLERGPNRLEERLPIGRVRRSANLGQERSEVRPQLAHGLEPVRLVPEVLPQHARDGRVRSRAPLVGAPTQRSQRAGRDRCLPEPRLAHACLAGEEEQPAFATFRCGEGKPEGCQFGITPDQGIVPPHPGESRTRPRERKARGRA